MGCNCSGNQMAATRYRLTRPDGVYSDYNTLDEARAVNNIEVGGAGTIRTVRVVIDKAAK